MQLSQRDLVSIKMTIVILDLAFLLINTMFMFENNFLVISNREIYAIITLNVTPLNVG